MDDKPKDRSRGMTVRELITELAKVDPGALVVDAPTIAIHHSGTWTFPRIGRSAPRA